MSSHSVPRPAPASIASQLRFVLIAAMIGVGLFGVGGAFLAAQRIDSMRMALLSVITREAGMASALLGRALRQQSLPSDAGESGPAQYWAPDYEFELEDRSTIDRLVRQFVVPPSIVKIKLFNRMGRTIYSPIPGDLGRPAGHVDSFAEALGETAKGYLEFRERFAAADGELRQIWIVATYTPIRLGGADGAPDAIAEFYSDVTKQFEVQREIVQREIMLLGLVLAFLFAAVLALVVWRQRRLLASLRKLEQIEAQFRDGIESMGDGFLLWDSKDRLVTWNQRCADLLPYSAEVFRVGLSFIEYIRNSVARNHPTWSQDARDARVQERIRQHRNADSTLEFPTSTGRLIELHEHRTSSDGRVSTFRDVTEQRLAERRVADSEAAFRDGIESMIDAFCLYDSAQRLLHWNTRYIEMFPHLAPAIRPGITMQEIFALHAAAPVFGIPAAERETWLARALVKATDVNEDGYRRDLADGRVLLVVTSVTAMGGFIHVMRDVTVETGVKQALARSEARFRDAIENMADGLALWDARDRLVLWNRRFAQMLEHLDPDLFRPETRFRDLAAAHALHLLPQASDAERAAWVEQRLAQRSAEIGGAEWTSKAGATVEIVERQTSEGGIVSVYRDVTAQRRATDQIATALERERQAAAHQKRFVSIAAHEFRTPLTIIDGAAQRLIRYAERVTPADLCERAQKIRAAAARMAQLVDTTLSLARLDDGRIEVNSTSLDLVSLLNGICKRLEGVSQEFKIVLTSELPQLAVTGDPRLLDQVFTNLVANAIKYSGKSQTVEIVIAQAGANATVAIRDHGIGIPANELANLFTRFYRASTAKGIPGTGIGLNLVRELLTLQGAEVDVVSEVDRGSTFTVTLPRAAADPIVMSAAVA